MKYRTGFVTNSSSSSYVVAFKTLDEGVMENCPAFAKKIYDYFIKSVLTNCIRTEEELVKYLLNYYCFDTLEALLEEDEYAKEKYEKFGEKIKNGYAICNIDVEYGDETMPDILKALHDDETFILISKG